MKTLVVEYDFPDLVLPSNKKKLFSLKSFKFVKLRKWHIICFLVSGISLFLLYLMHLPSLESTQIYYILKDIGDFLGAVGGVSGGVSFFIIIFWLGGSLLSVIPSLMEENKEKQPTKKELYAKHFESILKSTVENILSKEKEQGYSYSQSLENCENEKCFFLCESYNIKSKNNWANQEKRN